MTKKNKKGKKVGEVVAQSNVDVAVPNETINTEPAIPEVQKPSEPTIGKIDNSVTINANPAILEVSSEATDTPDKKKKKQNNKTKANNSIADKPEAEVDNVNQEAILGNGNQENIETSAKKKKKNKNKNKNKALDTPQETNDEAQLQVSTETKPDVVTTATAQKKKKNKKTKTNAASIEKQENDLTEKLAEEIKEKIALGQMPLTPPSLPVNANNKKNHKKCKPQNNVAELSEDKINEELVDDSADGEFEQVKTKKSQKRKYQETQKNNTMTSELEAPTAQSEVVLDLQVVEAIVDFEKVQEKKIENKQELEITEHKPESTPIEAIQDMKDVAGSIKEEVKSTFSSVQDKNKKETNKKKQNQKKPVDIQQNTPAKTTIVEKNLPELEQGRETDQPQISEDMKKVMKDKTLEKLNKTSTQSTPKPAEVEKVAKIETLKESQPNESKPAVGQKDTAKDKTPNDPKQNLSKPVVVEKDSGKEKIQKVSKQNETKSNVVEKDATKEKTLIESKESESKPVESKQNTRKDKKSDEMIYEPNTSESKLVEVKQDTTVETKKANTTGTKTDVVKDKTPKNDVQTPIQNDQKPNEVKKDTKIPEKTNEKKDQGTKAEALKSTTHFSKVEKLSSSPDVSKQDLTPRKASVSPDKCPAVEKPNLPPQKNKQQNKNAKTEVQSTAEEKMVGEKLNSTTSPTPVIEKLPEKTKHEESQPSEQDKQPEKPAATKQQPQQGKQPNKKEQKKGTLPAKSASQTTKATAESARVISTTKAEKVASDPTVEQKINDAKTQVQKPEEPVEDKVGPPSVSTSKSIADIFPEPAKLQSDKNVTKPSPPSYSAIAQLPPIGSPTELPLESSDDETNLQQIKLESERILKQTLQVAEGKVAEIKKTSDTLSESMKKLEETVAEIKKEVAAEKIAQVDKPVPQLPGLLETLQAAEDKITEINNVLSTSTAANVTIIQEQNLKEKTDEPPALPPRAPVSKEDVQSSTSSGSKNVEKGDFAQSVEGQVDAGVKSLQQPTTEEKLIEILDAQMATPPIKAPSSPIQKNGQNTKGKGAGKPAGNNNKVPAPKAAATKKPEVPPRPANLKPNPPATLTKSTPVAKPTPPKVESNTPVAKPASSPAKAMSPSPTPKSTSPAPKSTSPAPKSTSPAPKSTSTAPKSISPNVAPNVAKEQSPAPTVKSGPKPNGAVKKPEVPPRPANLKPAGATPKSGSNVKKPAAGPKPAATKEFDSRLLQQDTANKILAFIKTLASHPSNPDASINTLSNTLAEQQKGNHQPKSEQLTSKLLDLFLEVNERVKQKQPSEIDCDDEAMKALLTKDKIHLIDTENGDGGSTSTSLAEAVINVPSKAGKLQQPAKKKNEPVMDEARGNQQIKELVQMINAPMPNVECDSDDLEELGDDEDEEFFEFRFAPREVFIASTCFVCKINLKDYKNTCELCKMISYCSPLHRTSDADAHKSFCAAIQFIAKKRGGHCYHMSKKLNYQEFRNIRVYTLSLCETDLQRPLLSYEREILLFPRICAANICREWKPEALADCEHCGLVAYCVNKKDHLPDNHKEWCKQFSLYHKLVQRQKANGKIEPEMPSKIIKVPTAPPASMDDIFKVLYKNAANSLKDELLYSTMTQIATVPLTSLLGLAHCGNDVPENFTIHLVGAELQFEGEAIEKWESFFLHFVPQITQLNIVFIGPEFNNENLPLDVISRIRMCRHCRQKSPPRVVKFDFQCQTFYHDYANSSSFTQPNLICFFNPGLHRKTGYNAYDTWPRTIKAAANTQSPILVTSYTQFEAPKDLERLEEESKRTLQVVQKPIINKFASQRPERNFISDEFAPMIFKNYYYFVVK